MWTEDKLREKILNLRIWKRNGERAPHKPLLILYMLGRIQRGQPRTVLYSEVKEDLQTLLQEFGPPRKSTPIYPFFHLSSDGIWELRAKDGREVSGPSEKLFAQNQVAGGFVLDLYEFLQKRPQVVADIARILLERNFPETLHEDLLEMVGLDTAGLARRTRDPEFRNRILAAYEYKCAVCGFNVWLERTPVALEAAHIKWHQAGGPDEVQNGVALCVMHHKLFDRGVIGLTPSLRIQVAEVAHGTAGFDEWVRRFNGRPLRMPQRPTYQPDESFVDWHLREVFRGPARYAY